ncbi:flagellar protein FlgN [Loktanella agnita]|uniref:flagellar protein FlgN n=1 Tax=Loktanella agnita TaxID=287097 RepID=UPI003987CF86
MDEERTAIKTASFDALQPLAAAKQKLFDQMRLADMAKDDLDLIRERQSENQALLAAAISGVNAARNRITELQNVREGLSVYNRSGQMNKVPTRLPELEKKA